MAHGTNYQYESGSRYRIDNYDEMPGFCSFLPGIAGRDGVPLWCMYVNRAQAVVSFGVQDKDHAIAEFLPATWAYQLVGIQGFRTFCMIDGRYYEPFQRDAASRDHDLARTMWVESDRVVIQELNKSLGLTFRVKYFAAVNRPVAALVRELTISSEADRPNNLGVYQEDASHQRSIRFRTADRTGRTVLLVQSPDPRRSRSRGCARWKLLRGLDRTRRHIRSCRTDSRSRRGVRKR